MLTRLIAWMLWRQVKARLSQLKNVPAHMDLAWHTLLQEVESTPDIVAKAVIYQQTATEVMADRLTQRFDPGSALNEATTTALKRKAQIVNDPDPVRPLTGAQVLALKYQEEALRRRLHGVKGNE